MTAAAVPLWQWVLLWAVLIGGITIILSTILTGISPMPSSGTARRAVARAFPRDYSGTVLEAGCGWGGLAAALARRCPGARVIGYEVSPVPFAVAWLRALGHPNLTVRYGSFLRAPLGRADAVVLYLCGPLAERLGARLKAEARPGTPVLSVTFSIKGWQPDRTEDTGDPQCPWVHHYHVPARDVRLGQSLDRTVG